MLAAVCLYVNLVWKHIAVHQTAEGKEAHMSLSKFPLGIPRHSQPRCIISPAYFGSGGPPDDVPGIPPRAGRCPGGVLIRGRKKTPQLDPLDAKQQRFCTLQRKLTLHPEFTTRGEVRNLRNGEVNRELSGVRIILRSMFNNFMIIVMRVKWLYCDRACMCKMFFFKHAVTRHGRNVDLLIIDTIVRTFYNEHWDVSACSR